MNQKQLPIPNHFNPEKVEQVWRVPYERRASQAREWAQEHEILPAAEDQFKIALLGTDVQNTFCLPDFELFVAGRSGRGAVDDNVRLCQFIYRNLGKITEIVLTMDTHTASQIFHAIYLIDEDGNHPDPLTIVTKEDIQSGRWKFNTLLAETLGIDPQFGQEHLEHYVQELADREKFDLTIWPYHSMLGGIGHALVSAVEEAFFFHNIARYSQSDIIMKGRNALTEHYSAVGPEVLEGPHGEKLAEKDNTLIQKVVDFDAVIVAGQAKSHCVAWTVMDILDGLQAINSSLAEKVYLLEDCTSPVVVPDVVDYTDSANKAFQNFSDAGMHLVKSTDPIEDWPGIEP